MKSKLLREQAIPTTIVRPALRALTAAGMKNLEDVANSGEEQIAALHGVGPKAIRILKAALAAFGSEFQESAKSAQRRVRS